jgi:hypothetical protein
LNPLRWTPWAAVLFAACSAPTASLEPATTYCVVDSLIDYHAENPDLGASERYLPGTMVSAYRLTLRPDGVSVPAGALTGLFHITTETGDTLDGPATFNLPGDSVVVDWSPSPPGIHGTWRVARDAMHLAWPYPAAGPTWFWEFAQHTAPDSAGHWSTALDYGEPGIWAMHLRFEWEPCLAP